jgi:hypothetical protein
MGLKGGRGPARVVSAEGTESPILLAPILGSRVVYQWLSSMTEFSFTVAARSGWTDVEARGKEGLGFDLFDR